MHLFNRLALAAAAAAAAAGVVLLGGCSSDMPRANGSDAGASAAATAGHSAAPLPNLHELYPGVFSGGLPAGAAGFDELAAMGVQTVISVDGAAPDVEQARKRGMRYVHIPIGYNGMAEAQRAQLAKALGTLPQPIYVHCHHGRHRAPAALAAAAVGLGRIGNSAGVEYLRSAGTSPSYPGLYGCVSDARPLAAELLADPAIELPERAVVSGMVAGMVAMDVAFGHLQEIQAAGWRVPPDSPDLVPAAEAGQLADLLRLLQDDPDLRARPDRFAGMMAESAAAAQRLEDALAAVRPAAEIEPLMRSVSQSCTSCHRAYRD